MVQNHHVEGYENFEEYMAKFAKDDVVIIFFGGSQLPDGGSWCSDCAKAWPIVEEAVKEYASESVHFLHVEVGDRNFWKDLMCPFRTNKKTSLMVIPTMLKWNTVQKLEGEQCEKKELIEMLIADEE